MQLLAMLMLFLPMVLQYFHLLLVPTMLEHLLRILLVLDVLSVVVFTSLISVKGDDASVIFAAVVG